MGFILLFCCRTFVRCYMTILIVNGLWQYQRFVVYGALDQNSQEQKQSYFEDDNHVQNHQNLLNEDGWCHCRDQGPWHPLFKPSHPMPAASSVEETLPALENAIDASEHTNQIQALPSDLHSSSPSHLRKAKKQNHMIHLHLIPHIYVPVLHPVRHPVTYSVQNGDHHYAQNTPSSLESQDSNESRPHSYENDDRPSSNVPSDLDNEIIGFHEDHSSEHTMHHDDHSPFVPPETGQDLSQETVNQDAPNYINSHSLGHINHESDEFNHNTLSDVHYRHPPNINTYNSEEHTATSHHHQYQVHEESPHEHYYGDYPAGSNTKTQILPLNSSRHVNYYKLRTKQKQQDRSKLNKKYMILPIQVKKLRVMRPPPPAQKETWRTNLEQADSKLVPVKAFFDSKDLFKHPFFDFKSLNKPSYRVSMYHPTSGNVIPVPLSKPSYSKLSKSPFLVYPSTTNALRRRRDKILRS